MLNESLNALTLDTTLILKKKRSHIFLSLNLYFGSQVNGDMGIDQAPWLLLSLQRQQNNMNRSIQVA